MRERKHFKRFFLQAAMEYLMTYGWAILIIAVVLGVLYQLGLFSSGAGLRAQPGSCQIYRPNGPGTPLASLSGTCTGTIPQYVAKFDGSSSYITMGNPAALNIGQAVSISAWIYATATTADYPQIAGRVNTAGIDQYGLRVDPSQHLDMWGYNGVTNTAATTTTAVGLNSWIFVAGTYDGSNLRIYVNGALVSTAGLVAPLTLPGTVVFNIGYDPLASTRHFAGSISNVQVYNASLPASDIQTLYLEGIGGAPIDQQYVVGWWPLNGDGKDYSGNGNNGNVISSSFTSQWTKGYTRT